MEAQDGHLNFNLRFGISTLTLRFGREVLCFVYDDQSIHYCPQHQHKRCQVRCKDQKRMSMSAWPSWDISGEQSLSSSSKAGIIGANPLAISSKAEVVDITSQIQCPNPKTKVEIQVAILGYHRIPDDAGLFFKSFFYIAEVYL